ncbi:MAG: type II toxin-antitoxin system YafQ family toxin [Defluviitaleaceae bacterium]|nr:type II toxin-antitoxin system YafQ family toxin [Defluviitaleaceae bacterium]MCL2240413.1 type II toxin-antitoxin system YafQ family toxin [Defluviitaleaceae bacterium]
MDKNLLELKKTTQFRKDLKRVVKRRLNVDLLDEIIQTLRERKPLDPKHSDHALTGEYAGFRECHIQPDWLLIYMVDGKNLILTASRTGTHSDLF